MKKIIVFLIVIFTMSVFDGNSQSGSNPVTFTKQQSIDLLKEDYLFQYFKNPEDTTAVLDLFVQTVNLIVPINSLTKNIIREQALIAIRQQPNKASVNDQIYNMPLIGIELIPLLGGNANDVIKDNFNLADYELIYNGLTNDRCLNTSAYYYLTKIYKEEVYERTSTIFTTMLNPKYLLDRMFDDYDI